MRQNRLVALGRDAYEPTRTVLVDREGRASRFGGTRLGKGGVGTLKANGQVLDSHSMPRKSAGRHRMVRDLLRRVDTGTAAYESDYQVPFRFTGELHELTMSLGPEGLTPAAREIILRTYRDR